MTGSKYKTEKKREESKTRGKISKKSKKSKPQEGELNFSCNFFTGKKDEEDSGFYYFLTYHLLSGSSSYFILLGFSPLPIDISWKEHDK